MDDTHGEILQRHHQRCSAMRLLFLSRRYVRCGRRLVLLTTSVLIFLSFITVRNFSVTACERDCRFSQEDVEYFAKNIEIKFRVIQNVQKGKEVSLEKSIPFFEAEIALTNKGVRVFPNYGWSIFFNQILTVEPAYLQKQSFVDKAKQGIRFHHWNGQLYSFQPTSACKNITPGETKVIKYHSVCCSVTFTDIFPNWYIVFDNLEPQIIESTAGDSDRFVAPFNSKLSWKRNPKENTVDFDLHNPLRPQDRYHQDGVKDLGNAPIPVIPTPLNISVYKPSVTVNVFQNSWAVVSHSMFQSAIDILKKKWKLRESSDVPNSNYIQFFQKEVIVRLRNEVLPTNETYELYVNTTTRSIVIKASHAAGGFYAVQSLFSLVDKDGNIPETLITDGPRYEYRGLMIDVARNFHKKETIKRYIDAMAMYKLNKLHLHLTDDEGWRLEIPDLPELTDVGSKRCHDFTETRCLLPFLGSGPEQGLPGSGYYTVQDYKDILRHAVAHHVEVIPEIDMPGHGHAAIKAMEARFLKLLSRDPVEAKRYLLSDLRDESKYASVQNFVDGAINPCVQSTYRFIEKVVAALINIHKDVSPLKVFHYGGDEVPEFAWDSSPLCKALNKTGLQKGLKQIFVETVADIAQSYNLDLAAWEDGVMKEHYVMPRTIFPQKNIYAYAWKNLWVLHNAKSTYKLANAGYKVVLTPATNLYFDHPYEPDPEERGLIWATRFLSSKKVFKVSPENIYILEGTDLNGHAIPPCSSTSPDSECPDLLLPKNIAGIQGTLFGELARSEDIIDFMIFPRMLALAERAWHAADWEYESSEAERNRSMEEDWVNFANTLGYRELAHLDSNGFKYRIPLPGAVVDDGKIKASVEFPGLEIQLSMDGGITWTPMSSQGTTIKRGEVLLRTKAAIGDRYSRVISVQ